MGLIHQVISQTLGMPQIRPRFQLLPGMDEHSWDQFCKRAWVGLSVRILPHSPLPFMSTHNLMVAGLIQK